MPTITELPNDTSESYGSGLSNSDHQLQPMDSDGRPQNVPAQRDAGRVRNILGVFTSSNQILFFNL